MYIVSSLTVYFHATGIWFRDYFPQILIILLTYNFHIYFAIDIVYGNTFNSHIITRK